MDAVAAALLSSLLTLLGSGLLQARHRKRLDAVAADQRLVRALAEFGSALDAIVLELQQLPPTKRRAVSAWKWAEKHFTTLDFVVGRLARVLFGRELYAAIERLQRATNELMLIAPPAAVEALTPIFERLSTYEDRGEDWFELLQQERSAFAAISRSITNTESAEREPTREH